MELFVLGLVFGAATAKGKAVTKAVAKGYMAVTDKTRVVVANLREDMRGAIEEARDETEHNEGSAEVADHDVEALALHEETAIHEPIKRATAAAAGAAASVASAASKAKPAVMRTIAKSYMAVTARTRDAVSGLRENMRDAIEEARYERELAVQRAAEHAAEAAQPEPEPEPEVVTKTRRTKTETAKPRTRVPASAAKSATAKPTTAKATAKPEASTPAAAAAAPKPAARKRAVAKELQAKAPDAAPAVAPKRPGRKPKSATAEAMLEIAEIAADAL